MHVPTFRKTVLSARIEALLKRYADDALPFPDQDLFNAAFWKMIQAASPILKRSRFFARID